MIFSTGNKYKKIKVGELRMPIGMIEIDVLYRTEMTILPEPRRKVPSFGQDQYISNSDLMVKSDHFPKESLRYVGLNNYPFSNACFTHYEKLLQLDGTVQTAMINYRCV